MPLGFERIGLAVIVQDQLFFGQMIHLAVPTRGSSALRNFFTARNTLCRAAVGWHPSTRLTSSMHIPSKCRSTKAVRSETLSWLVAAEIRDRASPLIAIRSGVGSDAASDS